MFRLAHLCQDPTEATQEALFGENPFLGVECMSTPALGSGSVQQVHGVASSASTACQVQLDDPPGLSIHPPCTPLAWQDEDTLVEEKSLSPIGGASPQAFTPNSPPTFVFWGPFSGRVAVSWPAHAACGTGVTMGGASSRTCGHGAPHTAPRGPVRRLEDGAEDDHLKVKNLDTGEMQDHHPQEQLFEAAKTGKSSVIVDLLGSTKESGLEGLEGSVGPLTAEAKGLYGRTALHLAALSGQLESSEALLSLGAKIDAQTDSGILAVSLDATTALSFQHMASSVASSSSSFQCWEPMDQYAGRSLFQNVLLRNSRVDAVQRLLQGDHCSRPSTCRALRNLRARREERSSDEVVGPKSFRILSLLGRGSFGEVFQVAQKSTGQIFAMKVLRKNKIIGRNLMRYALTERNLLSYIRHPFIVRLHHAFQTPSCLVLVLQYYPGGNVSALLQREGHLPEALAKLYTAEVLLAIEHLHERNVVYRDLKPEILAARGFCLITKGRSAGHRLEEKWIPEGVDALYGTKSFCGSVAYLAPEILSRQGHGRTVDLYGLGVLLYEFIEGSPPYYSRDRDTLFRNIVAASLSAPARCSLKCQQLIVALMQRDPAKRLGRDRTSDVRLHRFFRGLDFDQVLRREVRVPPVRHWSTSFSMLHEEKAKVTNPFEGRLKNRFRSWSSQDGAAITWGVDEARLLTLPKYELATGGAAVQAWGSWTLQDEMKVSNTSVFTIGIAATSKDPRLRHYVVALVQHAGLGQELYRLGVVATVLPGHQSLERAWYYGLRMAAHYINLSTQVKFHVLSAKAWEAWVQGKHDHIFHDLGSLVTPEQKKQVKALSITMQQIRQMPTGHMTLKNRFHDATKAATEVALSLRPLEEETFLQQQDEKYKRIAPLAIKRVQHILDNKDHFMHQARENGKTLRLQKQESKKQAFADLAEISSEGAHAWLLKGRAKQCLHCLKRLTLHAKLEDLQAAAQERCPGNPGSTKGGQNTGPDEETKSQFIKKLLDDSTGEHGEHNFQQQGSYLVCQQCGTRALRNAAKQKLQDLSKTPCINQAWEPTHSWKGHSSHSMWRRANTLKCLRCKAQAMKKGPEWQASKALSGRCGGLGDGHQLPLVDELKAKGDTDGIIECRIKQLNLQRVLSCLHQFPLQPLIQAQAALAEAYGQGGYFVQAKEHLAQARDVCSGGVYDELQCRRLQADLLASEGAVAFAEGQLEVAEKVLLDAARLGRETRGELDRFTAHVHILLGQVATQRGHVDKAIDHFSDAWQAHEDLDGRTGEPTLRVRLRMADAQRRLAARAEKAVQELQAVVEILKSEDLPTLLVESSSRLSHWLLEDERDEEAFQALQTAEAACQKHFGEEDPKAIDVKRHMASLHIKLGRKKEALEYLKDVHYFERRLHGSQSVQVARTLKALGTVYAADGQLTEAEQSYQQALRIFETDRVPNAHFIHEIHAMLTSMHEVPA
eukprot:g33540.t2